MDLNNLLFGFFVAVIGIAIWEHLPAIVVRQPVQRRLALGVIMGCGAVGSMLAPMQLQPGLIFDYRSPLIAAAGFVGGPLSGAVAGALAILYRAQLGGIGVSAGCLTILLSAIAGAAGHRLVAGCKPRPFHVPLLSAAVVVGCLISFLALPHDKMVVLLGHFDAIVAIDFGGTWLFTLSLLRRERLRTLIENDALYRAIIEALPDSLNAKDRESRFVAANPATAHLMRAPSPDDLIGRSDADFYPHELAEGFRAEERMVLEGNTVGPVDQEVTFPDGSVRWLTSLKTPLRDDRGWVCGIITHNRDITDRRRLEAELAQAQQYLHEAMANMADGLVLFDSHGVIRFCNQHYRDLFPLTADLRVAGGCLNTILRAAVARGEEEVEGEFEAWLGRRVDALRRTGDRTITLRDGRTLEARSRPVSEADTLIVFTDITARQQLENELLRRATHDPLTGLANRAEFAFQLEAAQQRAAGEAVECAVMMMDLDRFKQVNDTFGHPVGDKLLIDVAGRFRAAVRGGDVVARLGGDEFAFLIFGLDVELAAQTLATRLLASLNHPFVTGGCAIDPRASLGIASCPRDTPDPSELPILADQALYAAKRLGGGRWVTAAGLTKALPSPPRIERAA